VEQLQWRIDREATSSVVLVHIQNVILPKIMTGWQQFLSQRKYEYWLLFWSHLHQMNKVWKVKNVSLILNVLMQEISTVFITKRACRKVWGSRDGIFEVRYRMYINLTKKTNKDIGEKLVVFSLNYCGLYLQVERTFIKNK
jgi:hypothetical protein